MDKIINKPKLNQPDVEPTTTVNILETGQFPPTIVSDKYPVKNYNLKEQEEQKIFKKLKKELEVTNNE